MMRERKQGGEKAYSLYKNEKTWCRALLEPKLSEGIGGKREETRA